MAVASAGRVQVCTSLQTDNHTSIPPLSFFTGQMPFLPQNQQRQSTEGKINNIMTKKVFLNFKRITKNLVYNVSRQYSFMKKIIYSK